MKKARNIKVIKSASIEHKKTAAMPAEIRKAESKKRSPVKVVNDWVREHLGQKQLAQQIALNLLYNNEHPDAFKLKN